MIIMLKISVVVHLVPTEVYHGDETLNKTGATGVSVPTVQQQKRQFITLFVLVLAVCNHFYQVLECLLNAH